MYRIMKRIIKLTILTNLKIALILAISVYSIFLCICKVIADIFHLPAPNLSIVSPSTEDNSIQTIQHCSSSKSSTSNQAEDQCIQTVPCILDSSPFIGNSTQKIPHCSSKVSTSVQTEESKQPENFGSKSSTDVIIYNLNSSQKLVITQGKFKCNQCECCKTVAKIAAPEQVENNASPTIEVNNSNISNMSIESDVVDSKIESGCTSTSASSDENAAFNADRKGFSSQPVDNEDSNILNAKSDNIISVEDADSTCLKHFNDTFNISSDFENFECLEETDSGKTYVKCNYKTPNKQKTSSPLNKLEQSPQNLCNNLSIVNVDQSQIADNKDTATGANSENWGRDSFGANFKRRLSLPVKLNSTNTSLANFKLAQMKLIEEALKNTKHEKSFKEVKYPFSSQISLDSKCNDEIDEKAVFSCSSYESLPVSDHIRNACNNNTLLSMYNENLLSEDDPDFSCIDNLVETFSDIKSNLLVPNLAQSKIIPSPISGINATDESATILSDKTLIDGKNDTKLSEEINLNASVPDMCNILDRFVSSDVKLSSRKTSKNFNDSCLQNDMLGPDVHFGDRKLSGTSDRDRTISDINESFESPLLKQEHEENKLNPFKFKFSSPLKSALSDLSEWSDDDEITMSSLKDNLECDNLQKNWQQSYHKIAFIDESPPHAASQNTLHNSRDRSLSENEKPTSFGVKNSKKSKLETSKYVEHYNLFPVLLIGNKSFGESTIGNKSFGESTIGNKSFGESTIGNKSFGESTIGNKSFGESTIGSKSFGEPTETNKNKPYWMTRKSLRRNRKKRELLEWTGDCEDTMETIETSNFSSFRGEELETLIEGTFPCETKHSNQNILETNCQMHQSQENSSSGDSASDNSVVTVKEL